MEQRNEQTELQLRSQFALVKRRIRSCCWSHNCSCRHFYEGFGIPNQPLRKTMHVSFFISCTASLLSLSALALDRYVAITYPLFYRSKLNVKRSLLVSAGVWTVSVLLSTISFASRLREISVRLLQHRSRRDIRGVNFHQLEKIFKFLRAQDRQYWDNLHNRTEENLAKKQAVKWEKKITKTLVIELTVIFSLLFAIVHLYLHHKLLR